MLDLEDLGDSVSLTEFTLDVFAWELMKYIEANRAALEDAPFGLYSRRSAEPGIQGNRSRSDLLPSSK